MGSRTVFRNQEKSRLTPPRAWPRLSYTVAIRAARGAGTAFSRARPPADQLNHGITPLRLSRDANPWPPLKFLPDSGGSPPCRMHEPAPCARVVSALQWECAEAVPLIPSHITHGNLKGG
jgi:hypothetical protein